MNNRKERKLLVETGRELLEKNIVARTWGNTSCRVDDEHCLITPSGLDYMQTTEEDIVLLNLKSGEWEGRRKPSGERGVHIAAYRQFPGVNFVIHTHQNYATAIGLTGIDSLQITVAVKGQLGGLGAAAYCSRGFRRSLWCIMACWSADVTKRRPWSVCSCWKRYVKETSVQLICKARSKRLTEPISLELLQRLWRDFCRKNIVMRRFFGRRQ